MVKDIIVLTDIGSVDPDDTFALLILAHFAKKPEWNIKGVITTHFYTFERAKMAKIVLNEIGLSGIPVYYGFDTNKNFLKENECWPSIFGYPDGVSDPTRWFPDFGRGFKEMFDFDNIEIEETLGTKFLVREFLSHTKDNKLVVVCLSPMHDLKFLNKPLCDTMELYVMGGGFEKLDGDTIRIKRAGYNWGICPNVVKRVMEFFDEENPIHLISSGIVRRQDVSISNKTYKKWEMLIDQNENKLARAIWRDWIYSMKGNRLVGHKNLCDALTVFLALSNTVKDRTEYIRCNVGVNSDRFDKDYLNTKYMFSIERSDKGNIKMVSAFPDHVKSQIIRIIESTLFGYIGTKFVKELHNPNNLNIVRWHIPNDKSIEEFAKNLKNGMKILQVVGDCGPLYGEQVKRCKEIILDMAAKGYTIQYGVTGKGFDDFEFVDVNEMVSDLIDNHNVKAIGNTVDYHTPLAIEKWGCTYPLTLKYYILVENENHTVQFGDDIMMDCLCDILLVCTGGVQSFIQALNCLKMGKNVICVQNMRHLTRPKDWIEEDKKYLKYFEASEFLRLLKENYKVKPLKDIIYEHMRGRVLYDKRKGDAGTKDALFEKALTILKNYIESGGGFENIEFI